MGVEDNNLEFVPISKEDSDLIFSDEKDKHKSTTEIIVLPMCCFSVVCILFILMTMLSTFTLGMLYTQEEPITDYCQFVTCQNYTCVSLDRYHNYYCVRVTCYVDLCISAVNVTFT